MFRFDVGFVRRPQGLFLIELKIAPDIEHFQILCLRWLLLIYSYNLLTNTIASLCDRLPVHPAVGSCIDCRGTAMLAGHE